MRYRRLDLNLLVALEALLTERSVTRAADRLFMTQPAMSGALGRLREYFDDPLLVQVGRQMELTPRAEALLQPIRDIILRIDSALAVEPDFEPEQSKRHFAIVASDYVIRVFLLDVLKKVHEAAPGISFEFRNSSKHALADLEAGEIDFVIGPTADKVPEHPHIPLFEDGYSILAAAENEAISDALSIEQFMAMGHVVFRGGGQGLPWADRWIANEYGDVRQIEVSIYGFDLLPLMVVGTDRIALLQTRLAEQYAESLPLKIYEPPVEIPRLTEILQWNKYRDEDPANIWFRNFLLTEAAGFALS